MRRNQIGRIAVLAVVFTTALAVPFAAFSQPFAPPTSLVSSLFGEKEDLELKDAINYEACFDYSEKMTITFSPECMFSLWPPIPAPVFKYKVEHTEPTAIIELSMEPGGGALKTESSIGEITGQGALSAVANVALKGGTGTKAYVGNTSPNMPTLGNIPNVYFDGHVWGVGPLGLLDAGKGGIEDQGGGKMNALRSMICWLADASDLWTPIPFKADAHLAVISPAAEAYVRYYLGDWGTSWYNKAGSAQVSATTATSFISGFGDSGAFALAALGAVVGHAIASGDDNDKCAAQAAVQRAQTSSQTVSQSAQTNEQALQSLAPRATYLPAGFEQVNTGYDTCPLTGVGHYVNEENGQIAFNNCDPQERVIQIDCNTGQGLFVDTPPGDVSAVMDPYQNPCTGLVQTFAGDPYVYVRAPSCHNRLSGFQEEGRYLACNSDSRTFASCGHRLTGRARMTDGHASGAAGAQEGPFELCLNPSGQRVVNHLDEHNQALTDQVLQSAEGFQQGTDAAAEVINTHIEENQIQCSASGGGGGSGIGGAVVGGAIGFGIGKGIGALTGGDGGDGGGTGIPGVGQASEAFNNVRGKISDALTDNAFAQKFKDVSADVGKKISGVKNTVEGKLSDLTEGAGLGSLNSVTSKAGAVLALDGSVGSITNLAQTLDVVPEWLTTAVSFFNQEKIIPLYLSEQDQNDWRSENPVKKFARISVLQNVPLASNASLFSKNFAGFNCGEVGVWGQLCPLRGFVETSGNNFPASGLAGWRSYHKALPKIPDRKRMKGAPTKFNLDYPHQSSCYDVGEDPDEWESRRQGGGGIIGNLLGGGASGLGSLFNSGASLGGIFGEVDDMRAETGVFVYTYWKNTKCSWDVCTSPFEGFSLSSIANIPGLEALQNVATRINDLKNNLPGADILKNSASIAALKNLPGANIVGGFATNAIGGIIPGGGAIAGAIGGFAGSGVEGGGSGSGGAGSGCLGPVLDCGGSGGGDEGSPFVPDYLGGSAVTGALGGASTLNDAFSGLENLPGAEALNGLISNMSPVDLPTLGNLGKILDFDSKE